MTNYEIKFNILENKGGNRDVFSIEPLERGFGHTLGNALRRVLLGQLSGASITRVKIDGATHEFATIKGVHEDVVALVQNLKGVNFKMSQIKTTIVTLDASGEGDITAGDLKCPTGIEVVNKDHHLATLSDKKSSLKMEITVEYGKGYRLPEDREKKTVGIIPIDANFSPVVLADYTVEDTRVGRVTNLDRLVMDVTTNGSITPKESIQQASAILVEYFQLLAGDTSVYQAAVEKESTEQVVETKSTTKETYLEELNLPTRVLNTLKKSGFETARDVRESGEEGLKGVKNIGPKTVKMLLKKVEEAK
ncbi:DNA-directed RNA polymerase subunit alpha [candidate division WWE3 bacterium]|nr:DNA-directed RNA polymerase subunit alpha [candidate division WWE3 bacterium]